MTKKILKQIEEMKEIGQELVAVARDLLEASSQTPSHEEIEGLQGRQEELLDQMERLDVALKKASKGKLSDEVVAKREAVKKLLSEFQQLNAKFIENVRQSQGVIQFDGTSENL